MNKCNLHWITKLENNWYHWKSPKPSEISPISKVSNIIINETKTHNFDFGSWLKICENNSRIKFSCVFRLNNIVEQFADDLFLRKRWGLLAALTNLNKPKYNNIWTSLERLRIVVH